MLPFNKNNKSRRGDAQGALPPAPPPKGLRPFGIPLMQRITCAAEGKMDFRFYPGQIPPDDGGICCFLARLGADSCRGRRRVAHDAGLEGRAAARCKALFARRVAHDVPHRKSSKLPPASSSKSRRRSAGFAPDRNEDISFFPSQRMQCAA